LDILVLKRKGLSERHIARRLGVSRNTVRKYIGHGDTRSGFAVRRTVRVCWIGFGVIFPGGLKRTWDTRPR